MKFLWHELARAECDEAVDYYLFLAGPAIARNFSAAVNQALRLVGEHPGIGAETYRQARRFPVHGFPFPLSIASGRMSSSLLPWPIKAVAPSIGADGAYQHNKPPRSQMFSWLDQFYPRW